jgi:Mlc titration factor MtfA (ptsG expression regulator)
MLNPNLFTLLTVSVLSTFSSILVYPTSYTFAQNATDDDNTTTEGIERAC